jgi:hypothetical protein
MPIMSIRRLLIYLCEMVQIPTCALGIIGGLEEWVGGVRIYIAERCQR